MAEPNFSAVLVDVQRRMEKLKEELVEQYQLSHHHIYTLMGVAFMKLGEPLWLLCKSHCTSKGKGNGKDK